MTVAGYTEIEHVQGYLQWPDTLRLNTCKATCSDSGRNIETGHISVIFEKLLKLIKHAVSRDTNLVAIY